VIAKGAITERANAVRLPAQTVERDYILAQVCADIGVIADARLVFKGGTLLRLCHFDDYRYSADLDFSAVDGLSRAEAVDIVSTAASTCRDRIELPRLDVTDRQGGTAWVAYIGPLGARTRRIKLDVSDTELVESHRRLPLQPYWPDLSRDSAIEGYTLDEVAAEKLRCIGERVQCRDLYDLDELLAADGVDALEAWHLYLRKAANDVVRGRRSTPPREWASVFERRMTSFRDRWDDELGDYLAVGVPAFADVERRVRRRLGALLAAARSLGG
jgi:predicted nucleotidyltransferase component of viral defense system